MTEMVRWIILLVAMLLLFTNGCFLYEVVGIPCPGCGITRAWLSCLSGDVAKAFSYNAFFLPLTAMVVVLVVHMLFRKPLSRWLYIVLYSIAGGSFLYNILRILTVVSKS